MIRRLLSLISVFIALSILATGCGSGSEDTAVTTSSDDATSESAASSADDTAEKPATDAATDSGSASGSDEPSMAASSPIGAFFAEDGGFEAAIAEYTVKVEEAIVTCMAAQGFEFKRSTSNVNEVNQLQSELGVREWTERYGYGISTSFDSIAQSQASDPNAEIMFSLSAAEREQWVQTLAGDQGLAGATGDFGSRPLEEQGCIGQALIETGGQEAIAGIETFGNAYQEGEAALFDRREMVDAVDAWSRCLSELGYTGYSKRDDPSTYISEKFNKIVAPLQAALSELTPEEGQALISGEKLDLADLPDLDVDALRAVQAEEIELALADLDCYDANVQAVYEPLRDAFENGLLTEYATEFEALRNIGG